MDIFITIVTWIIGLYAGFILLMAIIFAATADTRSGNDTSIISIGGSLLLLYLIWKGIASLFFSEPEYSPDLNTTVEPVKTAIVEDTSPYVDVSSIEAPATNKPSITQTVQPAQPLSATKIKKVKEAPKEEFNLILWLFYGVFFVVYFLWIFQPSKLKKGDKEMVKKKIIASMTFKEDRSGLKPWNPNWNPEDDQKG